MIDSIRPDYSGACVNRIIPALFGQSDNSWLPEPVQGATSTVFLVIDGLGWETLQQSASDMPVLSEFIGSSITTVAPSTTSVALTSITTGMTPAEHGIVGYRMRYERSVLHTLSWNTEDSTRPPDPTTVQRHPAFLHRDVPAITKSEFRNSGFTKASLNGARFIGWHTLSALVQHVKELVDANETFIYAYYPGPDAIAHEFGLKSEFFHTELQATDRLIGELLDVLPAETALLISADHGHVEFEQHAKQTGSESGWLSMHEVDPLVGMYFGDMRTRYLAAQSGAAKELYETALEVFGDVAWVMSKEQFLGEGWLGPNPSPSVGRRIGDVIVAAFAPVAFIDPTVSYETRVRSGHGSFTSAEMLVPLLAARGHA